MSSLRETITEVLSTVEKVANASVMGPEYADNLQQRLQANPDLLKQIASAAQRRSSRGDQSGAVDTEALAKAIIEHLVAPAAEDLDQERDTDVQKLQSLLTEIDEETGSLDLATSSAACEMRKQAAKTFKKSLAFVAETVAKMAKAQARINRCNTKINALDDSSDDEWSDVEPDAETTQKITELQTKREQLTKEKKQLQAQLSPPWES